MDADISEVTRIIVNILEDMTQDWGLELQKPIGAASCLIEDLEFTSVDVIQLWAAIEEHYDQSRLGLQDLLVVDGQEIDDLRVRELARFVTDGITGTVLA